ncbi:MAG: AI-2 transport protein TqsA [candidate division WS2 bacterium ADurb.Bin280]|uniref:AI-2 transport protein TqsA n=1 Tax=candidate division WS2 bacterium ADurb.Bin280 TaxID=1852829 RepID=A0A1V5SEB7_9BACT|nr:MAG: AI-2 transport protein TqsA [candidate division WS2 bacterium ADurb.Bin280]
MAHEISISSILKVLAVVVGLYLLYLIRDILMVLLVVFIISIALEPFVEKLAKQGVPKALSVIVLYFALIIFLGLLIYFVVPPVILQLREFTLNLPYSSENLQGINLESATNTINQIINSFSLKATPVTEGLLNGIISLFGGVVSAVTVFALTFYALIDSDSIRENIGKLIPLEQKDKLILTFKRVSEKLSDWLRGQLSLMLIIGLVDGLALWALGIGFSLTLGILSGLLEIIPVIGPIIAAVSAIFVALITGAPIWKILVVILIFIVVQQLENQILVPKIMQKAVGLSPIVVILAIMIGNRLLGIGGAILAVPIVAGIQVFVEEYSTTFKRKK